MRITDLVRSKDGSLSLTKLAAASFHLAFFVTVIFLTYTKREWITEMWSLYALVCVGHAFSDKTLATVKDYKDRQLEATYGGPEHDQ